jgi:hypothetical protein
MGHDNRLITSDFKGKGLWLLSLILLGGVIYFVVEIDRLRNREQLTESDLLDMIQMPETPLSTTNATLSSDEVILPFAQQPVNITPTPSSGNVKEPMVSCQIHENCGGGVIGLAKSTCENATCCQIGNTWLFYTDKAKCKADQNAYAQKIKQIQSAQQNLQVNQQPTTQPVATSSSN